MPDETDEKILDLLRADGRQKASVIAESLGITAGAVRRRIGRLEDEGVITGYAVVVNHEKVNRSIEAYVELTFEGNADVEKVLRQALEDKRVREASTLAGEPDAIVRVRADDVHRLRDAVTKLRELEGVTGRLRYVALHSNSLDG
jgi:DNA-binding Lrp family transcriptional regulator